MKWSQTVKNVTFKLKKRSSEKREYSQKDKKVVVASLPIKSIDEIELIKDLYRKKNQLQELLMFTLAINTALDNESEAIVQKAMDNLMKDRTVFIIAHRLSTIKNADRIAVINEGELVELGTHEELMNIENGQYKALYEMQFKKQEVI